jgi:hypothetical protein
MAYRLWRGLICPWFGKTTSVSVPRTAVLVKCGEWAFSNFMAEQGSGFDRLLPTNQKIACAKFASTLVERYCYSLEWGRRREAEIRTRAREIEKRPHYRASRAVVAKNGIPDPSREPAAAAKANGGDIIDRFEAAMSDIEKAPVDEDEIETVSEETGCSRQRAIDALRRCGTVAEAIVYLTPEDWRASILPRLDSIAAAGRHAKNGILDLSHLAREPAVKLPAPPQKFGMSFSELKTHVSRDQPAARCVKDNCAVCKGKQECVVGQSCSVCLDNVACVGYIPCTHLKVCVTCTLTLATTMAPDMSAAFRCPQCRALVERVTVWFTS